MFNQTAETLTKLRATATILKTLNPVFTSSEYDDARINCPAPLFHDAYSKISYVAGMSGFKPLIEIDHEETFTITKEKPCDVFTYHDLKITEEQYNDLPYHRRKEARRTGCEWKEISIKATRYYYRVNWNNFNEFINRYERQARYEAKSLIEKNEREIKKLQAQNAKATVFLSFLD